MYLSRTHPLVEGLATRRHGYRSIRSARAWRGAVAWCARAGLHGVTLLLVRFRYHIITRHGEQENPCWRRTARCWRSPGRHRTPSGSTVTPQKPCSTPHPTPISRLSRPQTLRRVIDGFAALQPHLDQAAIKRGEALLEAHRRVRTASQLKGISYRVEAQLPPDVLGIYVYLPKV